jgi:excisionase family DNA binding protein
MALTVVEAARFLDCSRAQVSYLCQSKKLPAKKIKGKWVIQNEDVTEYLWMQAHSVKAVARHHGVHPETIRRWLRRGKILGLKEGRWLVENPILKPIGAHKKRLKRTGAQETPSA